MTTETVITELKTVGPVTQRVVVQKHHVSRHHVLVSLLWFSVAIAAAVGLGQGDWYVREISNYSGQFVTFYYGLRSRLTCTSPAAAGQPGSTQANQQGNVCPVGGAPLLQTYLAIKTADLTDDERIAAVHLIGAGDIIIVVLSFAIVFATLAALINLQYAFRWSHDVNATHEESHHRGARVVGFLAIICLLLAIIFWVTIFPYDYARDQENGVHDRAGFDPSGFNAYLTIGVGLGIQIGGVIVGILAFLAHHHHQKYYNNQNQAVLPGRV